MKKTLLATLVMFSLAAMVAGCAGGAKASGDAGGSQNPLVGEWVSGNGDTIKFTKDVLYLDPDGSSDNAKYRYAVVDDTTLNLTRITTKNGVEFDDSANSREEHFNLDGDTLKMVSYGAYYRPNSQALKDARAAGKSQQAAQVKAGDAQLEANACAAVRSVYADSFEPWFRKTYPDSGGYIVADYAKMKNLKFDWGFDEFQRKVGADFSGYEPTDASDYMYKDANAQKFVDMVKAGKCPSGGTYTVKWDYSSNPPVKIECSVHPDEQ